jgi:hypothetical protein
MSELSEVLRRLDETLGKKKQAGKQDWAAAKKAFWKPKVGKNQIIVLTPAFAADPFTFWGYHKGLQEVDYYSVPCDKMNKNDSCVICDVVEQLKAENWEGNKHLWMPIEQKIDTYAPIIDVSSADSIAEGPKWFRISKTIMNQFVESIKNLEEGEYPFFDAENPQRILINYDKEQSPATQYSISFKDMKDKDVISRIQEWSNLVKPVDEFIFSKTQDANKKLVEEYFARMAEILDDSMEKNSDEIADRAESKLNKAKR